MGIGYLHYLVTLRYKNGISIKCNQFYCTSSKVTKEFSIKREFRVEFHFQTWNFIEIYNFLIFIGTYIYIQ